MSRMHAEFTALGCKLLALSCDSMEDHKVWLKDVETVSEAPVPFPIIADADRRVSEVFKMDYDRLTGDDSKPLTARTGYLISPDKEIVLISIVPWTVGRSFSELLRTLKALQLTHAHPVATPAEWVPGDKVFLTDAGKTIPEYTAMAQACLGLPSGREYITLVDDPNAAHAGASARATGTTATLFSAGKPVAVGTDGKPAAGSGGDAKGQ